MEAPTWLENRRSTHHDLLHDIELMIREKGKTCISIIVPAHRLGSDSLGDRREIMQCALVARQAVEYRDNDLSNAIEALVRQVDFNHNKEGIGLFVSHSIRKLVQFPFPVTKKIVVNTFFHLQDLLYTANYSIPYYVLDISKKEIRLFRGLLDHLEEVSGADFPVRFPEEYEYDKPAQSISNAGHANVKGYEKDKSLLHQIRLKNDFRQVDHLLMKYLGLANVPLLLHGPEKDVSLYRSVTAHADNIVGTMSDSHNSPESRDQEVRAWAHIQTFVDKQNEKLVCEIKEKIGTGSAAFGLDEVWNAAKEGRGCKLLVEKDFGKRGFAPNSEWMAGLHPKKFLSPDLVNEIITMVLEKNGKVIIVGKDTLEDYGRIAMLNRY